MITCHLLAIFFAITTRNVIITSIHVVQSSTVVFLRIKVIDGCKMLSKILHFIFKTKSLAPTSMIISCSYLYLLHPAQAKRYCLPRLGFEPATFELQDDLRISYQSRNPSLQSSVEACLGSGKHRRLLHENQYIWIQYTPLDIYK